MKTKIIQFIVFAYLLFCIYLVTLAEISFNELHYENWFIQTNYVIGMLVCTPAGLLLSLVPEEWGLDSSTSNFLLAFSSAALVALVVFGSFALRSTRKRRW